MESQVPAQIGNRHKKSNRNGKRRVENEKNNKSSNVVRADFSFVESFFPKE